MSLREDLNLLAPRLRRYARALLAGHPGPNEAADALVGVALRRAFVAGAASAGADLDVLAYAFLIETNREQSRAPGPRASSFDAPSPGAALGSNLGASSSALLKTGGPYAADLHPPEKLASFFAPDDNLANALGALKLEEREALLLINLEGFSYAQAARILKISRPLMVARLSRAREKLPKNLMERSSSRRTRPRPSHLRVVK